jgi:hypothetical protein
MTQREVRSAFFPGSGLYVAMEAPEASAAALLGELAVRPTLKVWDVKRTWS